jgi:hypothetical protein
MVSVNSNGELEISILQVDDLEGNEHMWQQ